MLPLRTKRLISTCFVAALWIGAAIFLAVYLLAAAQASVSDYRDARKAGDTLDARKRGEMPSNGLIKQYEQLKEDYKAEAASCAAFYHSDHNKKLDRPILKSYLMDPIQVANNYHEWKTRMAEKAGNPNFIVPYTWEGPGGQPAPKDFPRIEKRTCVADVMVDTLTAERGTVIRLIDIGEPEEPVDVLAPPPVDWDIARFRIYPVTASFTARFVGLGRLMNRFVANPTDQAQPCMIVRSIQITKTESPDTVSVMLGVDFYDFYRANATKPPEEAPKPE